MYAFRDRYAAEWKLNLLREDCPPIEATDPTLPPAARSAARKTLGLRDAIEKHGFNGIIAGIRRDEESAPRQGARLQPARRQRAVGFPRPAAGVLGPFQHRSAGRHASARPSAAALDRASTSGATSSARGFRWSISISPRTASATARWATRTSPLPMDSTPRRSTRSSPSSTRPRRRSAPAAPWTARPRTPSSACAPRDTCDGQRPRQPGPRARTACASSSSAMSTTASRPWSAA